MQAKDAVQFAMKFVSELFQTEKIHDLGLEEVVFNPGLDTWEITVGFWRERERNALIPPIPFAPLKSEEREYKIVEVSDTDGSVRSVKIRKIA